MKNHRKDVMCKYTRHCAMLMVGFVMTEVIFCRFEKEACPYAKNKEPDEPIKGLYYSYTGKDTVVVASGSDAFVESRIGQHIGDLSDGRKLYFIKPQNINIVGGTFTVVNGEGRETAFNFEAPIK